MHPHSICITGIYLPFRHTLCVDGCISDNFHVLTSWSESVPTPMTSGTSFCKYLHLKASFSHKSLSGRFCYGTAHTQDQGLFCCFCTICTAKEEGTVLLIRSIPMGSDGTGIACKGVVEKVAPVTHEIWSQEQQTSLKQLAVSPPGE